MSEGSHIPWNIKPKNGMTSFFTEETFNKWLNQDTHESRLDNRLAKLGINPPPRLTGPILSCKQKHVLEIIDKEAIKKETNQDYKDQSSVAEKGLRSEHIYASLKPEAKIKAELPTYNSQSEFSSSLTYKSSDNSGINTKAKSIASSDSCENVSDHIQYSNIDITKGKEHIGHRNASGDHTEEPVEQAKDKHDATATGEHLENEYEASLDMVSENIKPFSFYKEGTEEDYIVEETHEDDDDAEAGGSNDMEATNNSLQKNVVTEEESEDTVELTEEQLKELETQKEEEARKTQTDLMRKDKMFFNKKDRKATKYFPDIFKKKPRNRRSQLTCQEQKLYNDLVRCYGHLCDNSTEILDENFKKYLALKVIVSKEQELFQKYLRSISFTCKKDYVYIHPEVEKYAAARCMVKKQECFKYSRFYSSMDRVTLTSDIPNPSPTLQYVRPLLELGSVCKLVLPNIVHGMPQPCVTTNFNKINSICPLVKSVYKGTSVPVWNKVVCSKDANAEQLAVPNKCDVVMSSSSLRHLINNQGKIFKYWDMPFTVREYQINEGEKTTIHKVVYIDKPFIRQSQYIPKDRIQLYQKHAIRACAIRTNVRGHVFCGIKPVHEPVKVQTLEEVEHEVSVHEDMIKETVKIDDKFIDEDEDVGNMNTKKRKRKHGTGGMFDIEKDIDDLETFGMETLMSERSKVKVSESSPEGKVSMCTEKVELGGKHYKKGRRSTEEDLELLKNELKDIKTQAIKESTKHLEMNKDSHSITDKNQLQCSEIQIHEKNADNNEKGEEIKMVQSDVDQCAPTQDNSEVNDLKPDNDEISKVIDEDKEMESETTEENMQGNTGKVLRSTRKSRKDMLTVKNISSFSERLKQMSTIKSKLMHRNQGTDGNCHLEMNKTRSRSKSIESMETSSNVSSNNVITNLGNMDEERKTLQNMSAEAVDSDSDAEGLIIDVPTESTQKPRKKDKPTSPKMPKLESIKYTPAQEENHSVSSESEFGSPHLIIAIDDVEESEEKTTGKKRKSTGNVPKRILRSSLSRESSDSTQTGNQTLECKKSESRGSGMMEVTNDSISTLQRGMKVGNQSVSTRSRSASSESLAVVQGTRSRSTSSEKLAVVQGTSTDNNSRRVTRRSTGSAVAKEEVTQTIPLKRGRGRPKKNVPRTEKIGIKNAEDVSENNTTANRNVHVESDKTSVVKNELEVMTDAVDESDNDDDVSPIRTKAKVRKIDSDDESNSNSRDKFENIDHDKQHSSSKKPNAKKELSDLEAIKIKEMAAAMKKKVAEAKRRVNEDNKKIKDGTVTGNVKVDKKTGYVPDKVDSKEEVPLKQDSGNFAGLDKGLDNILKLPDKTHDTGGVFKGSAVDVFKQKHGMTSCEFPVEDNITYHQWNLSGTKIIVRCKYHGFISGQGLVHISPKIEYQPNFGFEQDTVGEICKNWISIYLRPNSTLLKPRINPFNSEIMMFENIAFKDLIPPDSLFKPEQAFTDLQVILDKLKRLPVGQYLLKNNPRNDQFTVLKATEQEEKGTFDLHLNNSNAMKCNMPSPLQWTPLNPNLMLSHQRKMSFIPCTFFPKDAQISKKKPKPQKFMKKKQGKKDS